MAKLLNEAFARGTAEETSLTLASLVDASDQGAQDLPSRRAIADVCNGKAVGNVSGWSRMVGTKKNFHQARALAAKVIRKHQGQVMYDVQLPCARSQKSTDG
jgi:hypothetical protein